MPGNNDSEQLNNTVIKGNYCIGCGGCASLKNSSFKMKLDKYGRYQADYSPNQNDNNKYLKICPFSDKAKNENEIAQELFKENTKYNEKIGYYINTYAGYVLEDDYRQNGSSGGMGSWILNELKGNGMIDYVIHVDKGGPGEPLFKYKISKNINDIKKGSSSRYYPISLSEVLQTVKNQDGVYAIIGVPCFIKSIRLLSANDPILKERIKYCVGLVCGHLKTTKFSALIAQQMGINPRDILSINFRKKIAGQPASDYAAEISYKKNGEIITVHKNMRDIYGGNWGYGFFKYNACDYCDDVFSETADVTIGDAWLSEYVKDSLGTNIVITRNKSIDDLLKKAIALKKIELFDLSLKNTIKSQVAGLRHRRIGLAYRLWLKKQKNEWAPTKRIKPSANHIDYFDKLIYKMRVLLLSRSIYFYRLAEKKGNLNFFIYPMKLNTLLYHYIYILKGVYDRLFFKYNK